MKMINGNFIVNRAGNREVTYTSSLGLLTMVDSKFSQNSDDK